jgi:hypothetical protein
MPRNENSDESQPAPAPVRSKAVPCAIRIPQYEPRIPAQIFVLPTRWIGLSLQRQTNMHPQLIKVRCESNMNNFCDMFIIAHKLCIIVTLSGCCCVFKRSEDFFMWGST